MVIYILLFPISVFALYLHMYIYQCVCIFQFCFCGFFLCTAVKQLQKIPIGQYMQCIVIIGPEMVNYQMPGIYINATLILETWGNLTLLKLWRYLEL
jgi:hypothetical protein